MRHWSAGAAVPALARLLETDPSRRPREYAVRALGDLWPWNADAIAVLIAALDDPHENVRLVAIRELNLLRVRATAALPALRRVASEDEAESNRADALQAINWIVQGTPAIRSDNPYRALADILEIGRFTEPNRTDEVPDLLEREDYQRAFDIVEAALEPDGQDEKIWSDLWCVAQILHRPTAARYGARAEEAWGGGVWREVERAVRSKATVAKGLAKIVRYHARIEPHPDWKLLHELPIEEELARLGIWIGKAFTEEPPPDDAPGLLFGLVTRSYGREEMRGISLDAGQLDDDQPDDLVIGGSWNPRDDFAYSEVLDRIYQTCHQDETSPLADAETTISLTYVALAIRALATTIDPDVLLGAATERFLAVGYPDGDCIGLGALRRDGLKFPKR